ncbi:hypothetical protein DFP72DRAFT_1062694 [Ephemerocybe angulata]|uniref:Uncharacterized protein n=1 Tax=Ephemerocybe angulata TaxID=980116 RepID=A0A8H6MCN2_9AGAR|nr:hypothetical protein DFP72DRAFT_1062694 [Tulosesus angulatus]
MPVASRKAASGDSCGSLKTQRNIGKAAAIGHAPAMPPPPAATPTSLARSFAPRKMFYIITAVVLDDAPRLARHPPSRLPPLPTGTSLDAHGRGCVARVRPDLRATSLFSPYTAMFGRNASAPTMLAASEPPSL